jgi:serine/threonine protein kinase
LRLGETLALRSGLPTRRAAGFISAGPLAEAPTLLPGGGAASKPINTQAPTCAGSDGLSNTQPGGTSTPEDWDFLAPPRGPGEIGWLGSYRVLKVLGTGGMGVVFQAEDPSLKRLVALKAMKPGLAVSASAGLRFLRE